jgi:hypothetical protein
MDTLCEELHLMLEVLFVVALISDPLLIELGVDLICIPVEQSTQHQSVIGFVGEVASGPGFATALAEISLCVFTDQGDLMLVTVVSMLMSDL